MKRKVVFGSMLSVFLLLSVAWVNPVYANETKPDPKGLHDKLSELSIDVISDESFLELIAILDIPEVIDVYSRLLDPDNAEDPSMLAEEYYTVLEEKGILNDVSNLLEGLTEKYQSDIEIVEQKFNDVIETCSEDDTKNSEYFIYSKNNEIKIKKQDPKQYQEQKLVFNSEEKTLSIPGLKTLSAGKLDDLIDFLNELADLMFEAGLLIGFIGAAIGLVALVCLILGLVEIGMVLFNIFQVIVLLGLSMMVSAGFLGLFCIILEKIADALNDANLKTKYVKPKILDLLKSLKLGLYSFFEQFLQKVRA